MLLAAGAFGFAWLAAQGSASASAAGVRAGSRPLFGPLGDRQFGMGSGAMLRGRRRFSVHLSPTASAARGAVSGDVFVRRPSVGVDRGLVAVFIFFPHRQDPGRSAFDHRGRQHSRPRLLPAKFFRRSDLGARLPHAAVALRGRLELAVARPSLVGVGTTLLGLVFALVVTRTGFRCKRVLRALTVLPIITPPFVIGLAIILLFGRSGTVTQFVAEPSTGTSDPLGLRLPGRAGSRRCCAFTPIAFLVLIGVVEGVSPSMEEAAQTLRANRWQTFRTVSLPLMRPGLANAFLLGFIESMADFGNPLVLGGNFDVLSTEIFFAIVGAQHDPGRAAMLAIVLLSFTLPAFCAQRSGSAGNATPPSPARAMPASCRAAAAAAALDRLRRSPCPGRSSPSSSTA